VLAVRYALVRLLGAVAVIWGATSFNFLLFRLAPGDAANVAIVANASPELQRQLRAQFGLDDPLWLQYLKYLGQTARGNLGVSFSNQEPVSHILRAAILHTLPLALAGVVLALLLALISGLVSAWWHGRLADHMFRGSALVLYALPAQWLGILMIFAFSSWLPSGGMSDPFLLDTSWWAHATDVARHLVLPAVTLALTTYGAFTVVLRSSMISALSEEYMVTALAKGLPTRVVVRRHALRNALLPTVNLIGLTLGTMVGGVILIESVFSWPGIGQAVYSAVSRRDYPVLQGAFLLLTLSVISSSLVVDVVCRALDPRTRRA
jgi:peptide/nickel transport system permease protein